VPALLPFLSLKSRTIWPLAPFSLSDKSLGLMSARPCAKLGHNRASENDKFRLDPLSPRERAGVRAMIAPSKKFSGNVPARFPAWTILLLASACLSVPGCGSKAGHGRHAQAAPAAEAAPPTPDTTPIEPLRTPAGLVLKLAETPAAVTPSPSPAKEPGKPAS
jgi:hypothetical protein